VYPRFQQENPKGITENLASLNSYNFVQIAKKFSVTKEKLLTNSPNFLNFSITKCPLPQR